MKLSHCLVPQSSDNALNRRTGHRQVPVIENVVNIKTCNGHNSDTGQVASGTRNNVVGTIKHQQQISESKIVHDRFEGLGFDGFHFEVLKDRQAVAQELYLCANYKTSVEKDYAFAEKAIALALLLDPAHKHCRALNTSLIHSLPFQSATHYDGKTLAVNLYKKAAVLTFSESPNDLKLGWYLNAISTELSGVNKYEQLDAILSEASLEQFELDVPLRRGDEKYFTMPYVFLQQ